VSGVASVLRRAGELLVEPAPAVRPPDAMPLDVIVTSVAAGAGATTVSHGLAIALRRLRPVELAGPGRSGAVAAGPGTAVVRDTEPAVVGALRHRGAGRVLVVVGDARREPAVAALVLEVLAGRHERVVLVGNRIRDSDAWRAHGALCVPESRLGAWLVGRARRPPGAMGAAFDALAYALANCDSLFT
jgi:hypothetical protein